MSQFIDRNCGILSQGQKQRVSIARSMIHSPEIFILDEPTNGLDVMTSRTIVRFIQFLRQEGKTVLLATHDMPLAAKLCDNFIYLHEGAVHTSGTIAQLSALHGTTDLEEIFSRLVADTEEVLFG
jgi:ABC-type Na+ transport system ATPase subunit NatA